MRIKRAALCAATMANSRFQYVKKFELPDALLRDTYLVTRLDGHRFTKFTAEHGYTKPNDERGLLLMTEVMSEWSDLVMAYGQSDEFSFLIPASSSLYGRRSAKISSSFVSLFSSSFVFFWPKYFPETPLLYPPNFDARVVSYPTAEHVRDYFGWRQADCHINNLYNTCFWSLVATGESKQDAQVALKGTSSGDKNELLFSRFGINYNEVPQRFRKGTVLYRTKPGSGAAPPPQAQQSSALQTKIKESNDARQDEKFDKEKIETEEILDHGNSTDQEATPSKRLFGGGELERKDEMGLSKMVFPTSASNASTAEPSSAALVDTTTDARRISSSSASTVLAVQQAKPQPAEGGSEDVKAGDDGGKILGKTSVGAGGKRFIKKGHAPPGVIVEGVCDLIRDDFWDRNPHILAGVERRR